MTQHESMTEPEWTIRVFDPFDNTTLGTVRYESEGSARESYEFVCDDARKNGGGYELRHNGKYVCMFAVTMPKT